MLTPQNRINSHQFSPCAVWSAISPSSQILYMESGWMEVFASSSSRHLSVQWYQSIEITFTRCVYRDCHYFSSTRFLLLWVSPTRHNKIKCRSPCLRHTWEPWTQRLPPYKPPPPIRPRRCDPIAGIRTNTSNTYLRCDVGVRCFVVVVCLSVWWFIVITCDNLDLCPRQTRWMHQNKNLCLFTCFLRDDRHDSGAKL